MQVNVAFDGTFDGTFVDAFDAVIAALLPLL